MRYPCSVRLVPSIRQQPVTISPYRMVIRLPWLPSSLSSAERPEVWSASLFFDAGEPWIANQVRDGEIEFLFWDKFPLDLQDLPFLVCECPYVTGEGTFL